MLNSVLRLERTVALVLSVVLSTFAFAQTPSASPTIQRDQAAINVLTSSVNVLGGNSVAAVTTLELTGNILDPKSSVSRTFDTKYQFSGGAIQFRKVVTSSTGITVFGSGGGKPAFQPENGKVQSIRAHVINHVVPYELPAIIFAHAITNDSAKIVLVGSISPSSPTHIRIEDESTALSIAISTQDWYFDPVTNLPIRVEYKVPDVTNPFVSIKAICDYVGFSAVSGIAMPTKMRVFEENSQVAVVVFTSVQLNGTFVAGFDAVPGVN